MLELALAHAARGFLVFPIVAGQKSPPLVKDWPIHATSDPAQIRAWWTQWPTANVGIHCAGLLVLDVDEHKNGFESLTEFEKEVTLEATFEVQTPRGGRHIFYRCAHPVRNGVDVLGRGVDIRTAGGYVVGAGSRTAAGEYVIVADEPIADADDRLVSRVVERLPAPRTEAAAAGMFPTDADAAVARAQTFLLAHPVATQGQGGDHHTYRTVARVKDFGVPRERAAEALAEWNERCVPPWEAVELESKIRNAYAYGQNAPGNLTPEALGFEEITTESIESAAEVVKPEESKAELIHPADVAMADVLGAQYLVKGWLEQQSNAVIFGQWNAGKTFMVLDMGASIACGQEWFGHRVRQGAVLYLGYEGLRAMKKRMIALREKYPMLKDVRTPFEYAGMVNPLTVEEGQQELSARLKEFGRKHKRCPDLLIIDPLVNALGGDDSDANLMAALNREVAKVMKANSCTVLRVHHSGHGDQDRARGHSSLPAAVDTEIRVSDGEVALTKQRDDTKGKHGFKLLKVDIGRDMDGDLIRTCVVQQVEPNALDPALTEMQEQLMNNLLDSHGEAGHVTERDMRDAAPPDMDARTRRRMVHELVMKRYLRVEGKGYVISERGPAAIFDSGGNDAV